MQKISVEVKQKGMRYPTVGDYYRDEHGRIKFEVLDTEDLFSNILVLVHEMVEFALIERHGVAITNIEKWDRSCDDDEPGANPNAPYHREHVLAEHIEKKLCIALGLSWDEHNERVGKAFDKENGDAHSEQKR